MNPEQWARVKDVFNAALEQDAGIWAFPPIRERMDRLEEALTIIRALWESGGEPISSDGPTWPLKNALFTTPLYDGKAPTVWIAAHAPRMLGLTGRSSL